MLIEQKCDGSNEKKSSQIEAKWLIRKHSLFMHYVVTVPWLSHAILRGSPGVTNSDKEKHFHQTGVNMIAIKQKVKQIIL